MRKSENGEEQARQTPRRRTRACAGQNNGRRPVRRQETRAGAGGGSGERPERPSSLHPRRPALDAGPRFSAGEALRLKAAGTCVEQGATAELGWKAVRLLERAPKGPLPQNVLLSLSRPMTTPKAKILLENGAAHALAALVLFRASYDYGRKIGVAEEKIDDFAFNGTCSLSVHYLIGLGLELLLKAAYVAHGGDESDLHLRNEIGHDLEVALRKAQERGYQCQSDQLAELVGYMNRPYKNHVLRYNRPDGMFLPNDIEQVSALFDMLQSEIAQVLPPHE